MADFSAVEARTARAVIRHLSNRTCVVGGISLPVIYDESNVVQEVGGILIESTGPRFVAVTADLPAPITGAAVIMPDTSAYKVRDHQPGGTGTSLCLLHKD